MMTILQGLLFFHPGFFCVRTTTIVKQGYLMLFYVVKGILLCACSTIVKSDFLPVSFGCFVSLSLSLRRRFC